MIRKTFLQVFNVIAFIICMISAGYDAMASDVEMAKSRNSQEDGFIVTARDNRLDERIVINICVPSVTISEKHVDGSHYSIISIAESGDTGTPGEPLLPMIGHLYHISDRLCPEVSVRVIRSHIEKLPYPVIPSQEDMEIVDIQSIDSVSLTRYHDTEWYPRSYFHADAPVILRDVRLLPVAYYPVRYHAKTQTIEIIDEAELIIQMVDAPSDNILEDRGPYSPSWEQLYHALIPNYQSPWTDDRDRNVAEHYLLIMPDMFESRCQGFIAWKEQQGFVVDVLRLSDISSNPTAVDIKNAILARYNSESKPVYSSIFGSTNNFPIHTSHDSYMYGDFDDDLYYSQMAGNDLLPDIFLSRYPVVNVTELSTMLNRIMNYEIQPNLVDPNYYKTALMACSGLYESQQTTKEQTAARLDTNLNYDTIHTMYQWSSGSIAQIQNWVAQGVSIINYRGEGWQDGWHPGHSYSFDYSSVYSIRNSNKYPVITSIGCGVAMFDGYTECFGHAWVTLGEPDNPRGAVAFMGPTWNTRTTINNWIDRGIYRGFCYHDLTRSAPAFVYGKIYAYTHFLGTPYMTNDIPTHMREYILFGNPDLWWRTDIPRRAEVYNAWCPGSGGEGIVVIDDSGNKVANAQVSFIKDNERRVYITDGGGGSRVYMDDLTTSVPCTLTGWNLLPVLTEYQLPSEGDDGDLVITEVKPDIVTTGTAGDKVEIANLELEIPVNLKGWTIGDLDGYDQAFVNQDAILGPQKVAVIEFVGYFGTESVEEMSYGLLIKSRAVLGLSSEEDTVVLRNTRGRIRDAICYHNGSGIGSTSEADDMTKLTQPTSPLPMGFRGWWSGPDDVTREQYEAYAIDWSPFAGNGGLGSIQRISIPGPGIYDSAENFSVNAMENFGYYQFESANVLLTERKN